MPFEAVPGITTSPEYVSMALPQLSLNMGCLSILLNTVSINGVWMLVENSLSFLPQILPTLLGYGLSKANKNVGCCHHHAKSVELFSLAYRMQSLVLFRHRSSHGVWSCLFYQSALKHSQSFRNYLLLPRASGFFCLRCAPGNCG